MKILLIEDDKLLSAMYRDGFKLAGHSVVTSDSAQDSLNKLDKEEVDLIILDMFLPGRSGVEVLHELGSYADWQKIPVILMSDIPREDIKISDENLAKYSVTKLVYKPATSPTELISLAEGIVAD